MPRTRSLAWSELKIGVLTAIALGLAATLIFLVGGEGGFFWQRYSLKTRFSNAMGLKPGAVVRLAGVDVGSVEDVAFAGTQVEVTFQVSKRMRERITTDSVASLGSLSLLGEATIELTPSSTGTPHEDGDVVASLPPGPQVAEVTSKAAVSLDEVNKLLVDVRGGRGTLGKLVTDTRLYDELNAFLGASQDVVNNLNKGRGTLGRLMNDPVAYNQLRASLENLTAITGRINNGEGSLGRLLKDEAFAKSLGETTKNLEDITGRVQRGEGTVGKLVNDSALYGRLDSLTARLDTLIANLHDGEGTAGQLLRDRQLYENMNGAASELRSLIAAIRADPKKYLNVKVSIF